MPKKRTNIYLSQRLSEKRIIGNRFTEGTDCLLFLLGRSCLLIFDYSAGQEEYFGQDY